MEIGLALCSHWIASLALAPSMPPHHFLHWSPPTAVPKPLGMSWAVIAMALFAIRLLRMLARRLDVFPSRAGRHRRSWTV
jgi:hypothetical protein